MDHLSYGEKKLTRLTYPKQDEDQPTHLDFHDVSIPEAGQVQYLKRLLVTVKQHYEKSLHQLQIELQSGENQRLAAQKEHDELRSQLIESQNHYEEELQALREQQKNLKDILKKTEDELVQSRHQLNANVLKIGGEDHNSIDAEKKVSSLCEQLEEAQFKIGLLNDQLIEAEKKEDAVRLPASADYLRCELEEIKRMLVEDAKETKVLEERYIEVLNEKISLDYQTRQLQQQLENQSCNLIVFQEKISGLEETKKKLELSLEAKEVAWMESCQQREELLMRVEQQVDAVKEKELIQEQYEQLKDQLTLVSRRFEEVVESRGQLEEHLNDLEVVASHQRDELQEFAEQVRLLHQEKEMIETERDQMRLFLEESESGLKVAHQHMAKKVKEAACLTEKLESQQADFTEFLQTIEDQKGEIAHLQASIDFYEKQEKKLQEQLHDALKGNESQIAKWEEKYFLIHDKWLGSEKEVRELKKFEEKHLQMQSLLANLGNFMGGHSNTSQPIHAMGRESGEMLSRFFSPESSPLNEHFPEGIQENSNEEKYNLFGMPHSPHKN